MARKPRGKRAENLQDFAGPDADKETIEKLAEAAKKANAKGGDNSEPSDEAIDRNFDAIELALVEIDAAGRIMQKARASYSAVLKTAKTDFGGSKAWVSSVDAAVKLKRQSDKGGAGSIVTEHRQIGRALRVKGVPLGTQFNLFAMPADEPAAPKDEKTVEAEATLAGEHAGLNGEPKSNNTHTPGTPAWFGWNNGWQVGADKLTDSFKTGAVPAAASPAH